MAINPALLIAAPMLQDYFVDNATGAAMSAGIITCYQDNSRTTLKNWYYQSGTPGNYTYITLPNPLTLSAVGTIDDVNGNDTIPFFYPYDEDDQTVLQPYYITVVDSNGQAQFVRQNFPFISHSSSGNQVPIFNNILSNNVFYHNIGSMNVTNVTNMIIAPSQHDGFLANNGTDFRFVKNTTGATDNITFTAFGLGNDPFLPEVTPEYYLNFDCSASQAGETLKAIQVPISLHIKTLESISASFTIWAQNVGGNVNNTLNISIQQFLGTGAISPSITTSIGTITLNDAWTKYIINFIFPSAQGLTVSNAGDDALYLLIGFPLSTTCNINFTKPSIFLSDTIPTNEFETYDQIDTIINSPRTGDVRTSINSFYPFGWVPMNNYTIGNASSNAIARANIDTFNLFSLLWSLASPYDSGSNFNPICQMFTSSLTPTNFGVSAISDFNANKQLSLTQMLGNVIMGTVPSAALFATYKQVVTASNSGGHLLLTIGTSPTNFYVGQPVTFTTTGSLPGNIVANAIYYIVNVNFGAGTFNVATSYANAIAGTVVAFSSSGSNNTVIFQPTGATIGEYSHTLSIAEMPSHSHPPESPLSAFVEEGTGLTDSLVPGGGLIGLAATTGNTGGGAAHNNVQPVALYNMYMKL